MASSKRRVQGLGLKIIVTLLALTAPNGCLGPTDPGDSDKPYEVWLIDQSDSPGKTYGGTLHIFDGTDLVGPNPGSAAPRDRIDLGAAASELCLAQTGANPVRPHMLLFNRQHTHAILSFVASGHVLMIDAAERTPIACIRTTQSPTGRQAHAAFPSPDGAFVLIANQNGKRLERVDANFATSSFTHNPAATLDLATCTTPSGQPCQSPALRPDNAPICPIIDSASRYAFVTLRGGGMFVVDLRKTPMEIVAEYDLSAVKGNGCGGTQVDQKMYVNSGGRPGNLSHLQLYGFDVYRFPVTGFQPGVANMPAPERLFSVDGEHDSHGMVATGNGSHLWVMDRHANQVEVISTSRGMRVNTFPLRGALSPDPAPDLADASPAGDRVYVAFRGSLPLSGDPHIATGVSPGLGILDVESDGSTGRLVALIRISNIDAGGVERADAHAVRVRRK